MSGTCGEAEVFPYHYQETKKKSKSKKIQERGSTKYALKGPAPIDLLLSRPHLLKLHHLSGIHQWINPMMKVRVLMIHTPL
jgi:hypothetical protein